MSLMQLHPTGCILATTSGTLVLLHHTNQGISCKHLQPSSNLLGGIGRRVSSLLWGSITGRGLDPLTILKMDSCSIVLTFNNIPPLFRKDFLIIKINFSLLRTILTSVKI